MKKIIISLSVIAAVAVVAVYATTSYFSDEETLTGNTFTAGELDLKVDNEQHYNNAVCVLDEQTPEPTDYWWQLDGAPMNPQWPIIDDPCNGTWASTDLGAQKFFEFADVK